LREFREWLKSTNFYDHTHFVSAFWRLVSTTRRTLYSQSPTDLRIMKASCIEYKLHESSLSTTEAAVAADIEATGNMGCPLKLGDIYWQVQIYLLSVTIALYRVQIASI